MPLDSGAMPDTSPRLPGAELRRLRREHQMKIAELARRMEVDPRTVTRWETAAYVPDKVLPALQAIFTDLADPGSGPAQDDPGPLLREASDIELAAEIARRIDLAKGSPDQYPPIDQERAVLPRSAIDATRRGGETGEVGRRRRSTS